MSTPSQSDLTPLKIANELWAVFGTKDPSFDTEKLAIRIAHHHKFIERVSLDEFAGDLFVECLKLKNDYPQFLYRDLLTAVSRVQKRIFRLECEQKTVPLVADVAQPASVTDEPLSVLDFIDSVRAELSIHELVIFEMRFVDGLTLVEIARKLGLTKSTLHRDVAKLIDRIRSLYQTSKLKDR